VRRSKAVIVNLQPYVAIDEMDPNSAKVLLILHHKRYKSFGDIDESLKSRSHKLDFEDCAVDILKKKIDNNKRDLCSSFDMCVMKSKNFQKTLSSCRKCQTDGVMWFL
jgi:hypothetical protein